MECWHDRVFRCQGDSYGLYAELSSRSRMVIVVRISNAYFAVIFNSLLPKVTKEIT